MVPVRPSLKRQDVPYTGVSRDEAVVKCTGMGSGYDLLTNDGWQSMTRHIELVADNWGGGNVGSSEGLSQGHSYSVPNQALAASSDDNKGCHGTEQTCDGHTWNKQRRTHTLSNGEVIWDVSGNAWEWVKDDNSDDDNGVYGDNAYMSQVTSTSHTTARSLSGGTTVTARVAKDQFGPSGDFSSLNSGHHGGLGYGYLNQNGGAVTRGGSWSSGEYGGVFQVSLANSTNGGLIANSIGFRCVYYPGSQTPTVSIDESESIDRTNASSFRVSGSCSEEGRQVEVSVGGVSTQVDCAGGVWVAVLDVTGLNKTSGFISITAHHSSSDGRSARIASKSVVNDFICPENFVGVPSLGDYTVSSFCVSKYEMKNDGSGQAVSQAAGAPYTGVRRDEAVAKCTGMGSGYDLLTNDGWQSMARHIELVADNWSGGNVGSSEGLSQGHAYSSVPNQVLAASSDDNKGCYGTDQTCDGRTWNKQRRTHTLSNGEVIWDVSGNAWEWVKDDNSDNGGADSSDADNGVYGDNAYMSQVTSTSHTTARSLSGGTTTTARVAKDQFGPSGDFSSLNSDPHGGLGYGHLNENGGAVVRGGSWESGKYAGVFQVSLAHSTDGGLIANSIGFRCVYYPRSQTPTVSIDEPENIDDTNASSFRVSGSCSEEGRQVEVSIGGVKTQVDCVGGTWVAILDVTGLNKTPGSISITANHSDSDGRSARPVSKSVINNFICPENFVGVPSLEDYTVSSFCVSKYEMKNDGSGNAVSQAAGVPYTGVSRDDAVTKCTGMGSSYDLLTNDGWQSIARHIELVGDNWSGGNVGSSEGFSQGHSYESPNDVFNDFLVASSDDNKGCYGTDQICDGRTWNRKRRTHTFSSGEVIWDVSGNAWEWMKDDNSDDNNGVYGDNAYMSQVTSTSHTTARSLSGGTTTTARVAKDQFGPSGDFSSLNSGHHGGLGYGYLNQNGGAVIRGGSRSSGEYGGIFQVSLAHSNEGGLMANSIGFRCVYYPGNQIPTVSIDEFENNIDRTNVSSFRVSGSCSEEGRQVEVSVGGVNTQVDCMNDGSWVAILDVTGLNKTSGSISITANHSSSDGRSAHIASESVTNNFICPENFVGVPSLGDYTVSSFCVSKYEMKNNGSGQTVSQAAGVPYTGVSRDEAVVKCINMGSGYDLLTNDGWQSMARHIELVGDNWGSGNVGSSEGLSQGHAYSVPNQVLAASSDDNKGCHGTEQTCDGRTWNKQRRTHTFSNGEVIWDVSGNAWEWVKDDNSDSDNDDNSD